ncbi:hypothetical protein C8A03DRAFT_35558 [Achaetomium macrosporum]|uniref:Uncharacterized protein n=1 Tax=Achaetomium macrosporum TaxID=79813 RepID=A0AAN7C6V8_9PEZI|nr:hypothetical protein C8A03DRAFT_35558 [Achaetomium macrosporum]
MPDNSSSARPAPVTPAPPQPTEAERAREARMQEHWKRWAANADKDRSYPVVFDQPAGTNAAATAVITRMLGHAPKLSPVKRLPGLEDTASDLGNVQVSMVSAGTFAALKEKFQLKRITVMLPGNHERTAFIPGAAKSSSSN